MKHTLYILYLLFTVSVSFAQTDSASNKKLIWGVSAGSLFWAGTYALGWTFNHFGDVTIEKKKHLFALGPVWGPKWFISPWSMQRYREYKLSGMHFTYQLIPSKKKKVFNIFYQYQLSYKKNKDSGMVPFIGYTTDTYKSFIRIIESHFGIGYKLNFWREYYLTQSVNVSLGDELINYDEASDKVDWRSHSYTISGMTNITLGYKFDN